MRTKLMILALIGVLAFAGSVEAVTHVVKVRNFEFSPRNLTIATGDFVRWEWESGTHTTTSGTGSSSGAGLLWDEAISAGNQDFQRQFNEAGTFPYFCRPHELANMKGTITVQLTTAVFDEVDAVPDQYFLSQNFPNPFNPSTTIQFGLEASGYTTITIYNLIGQPVADALDEYRDAGLHQVYWDGIDNSGTQVPSGIYFYRLQSGEFKQTRKMVLLK